MPPHLRTFAKCRAFPLEYPNNQLSASPFQIVVNHPHTSKTIQHIYMHFLTLLLHPVAIARELRREKEYMIF